MTYDLEWLGLASSLVVMGGVTFPLLVSENGIVSSLLSACMLAYISNNATKSYISKLNPKRWSLEMIVQREMGKRWRTAFVVTKIAHLLQLILIYSLNLNDLLQILLNLPFSSGSFSINKYITTTILFILIGIIFFKSTGEWQVKYSWISGISLLGILIILVISCFSSGVTWEGIGELIEFGSLSQIPQLFAYNNLSFENQIYLTIFLQFSKPKTSHYRNAYLALCLGLIYVTFCGIIGSLCIHLNESFYDSSSYLMQAGVLIYFPEMSACSIIIKIFLFYHLIVNVSLRVPILISSVSELLSDKQIHDKYLSEEELILSKSSWKLFKFSITLSVLLLLILLVIAAPQQQGYITTLTGSFSAFMILYRIPYGLKYSKIVKREESEKYKKLKQDEKNSNDNLQHLPNENFFIGNYNKNSSTSRIKIIPINKKQKWIKFKDQVILLFGYAVLFYGLGYFIQSNIWGVD